MKEAWSPDRKRLRESRPATGRARAASPTTTRKAVLRVTLRLPRARRRHAIALACVLLVLAGGVVATAGSKPDRSSINTVAVGGEPSQEPLAVFRSPRGPEDVLSAALARSAESLAGGDDVREANRNGAMRTDESRFLLGGLGVQQADIYAFPSAKGLTCYTITTAGGGCQERFTAELPVSVDIFDADGAGRGVPTAVAGLVPNNVIAVSVVSGDTTTPAMLDNNAYFLEATDAGSTLDALVVTFSSGKATRIILPTLPGA